MLTPLEEAMEMILNGKENSPLILRFRSCWEYKIDFEGFRIS
jgi:hypothetical protein